MKTIKLPISRADLAAARKQTRQSVCDRAGVFDAYLIEIALGRCCLLTTINNRIYDTRHVSDVNHDKSGPLSGFIWSIDGAPDVEVLCNDEEATGKRTSVSGMLVLDLIRYMESRLENKPFPED